MANHKIAWEISKSNEGGYAWHPNDIGGETYRGIARNYNKSWNGFREIDRLKKQKGVSKLQTNFVSAYLDQLAEPFYKKKFWDIIQGDKIKNQSIANMIYDHTYSGPARAIDSVIRILNENFRKKLIRTSKRLDDKVINALNSVSSKTFFEVYKKYRKALFDFSAGKLPASNPLYKYYQTWNKASEAAKKTRNTVFHEGWINRVEKYSYDPKGGTTTAKTGGFLLLAVALTIAYKNKDLIIKKLNYAS